MAKMVNFECKKCGKRYEWFDDEKQIPCVNPQCKGKMKAVFSPKENSQRMRINDVTPFKMPE